MTRWPKSGIITGLFALHLHGLLDIEPNEVTFAVLRNSEKKLEGELFGFKKPYKITSKVDKLFAHYDSEVKGKRLYSLERVIAEIGSLKLNDADVTNCLSKAKSKLNMGQLINVVLYLKKNNSKYKPHPFVLKMIDEQKTVTSTLREKILDSSLNTKDVIKDHILSILSSHDKIVMLKGGSAIKMYMTTEKRDTHDLDIHSDILEDNDIENFITKLNDRASKVWFVLDRKDIETIKRKQAIGGIAKFNILTKVKDEELRVALDPILKSDPLQISLNFNYSHEELKEIKDEFSVTKRPVKYFPEFSILIFTEEMILAEKIYTLAKHSAKGTTSRYKDAYDVFKLYTEQSNIKDIVKWIVRKTVKEKKSYNSTELKELFTNALSCDDFWNEIKSKIPGLGHLYSDPNIKAEHVIKSCLTLCEKLSKETF